MPVCMVVNGWKSMSKMNNKITYDQLMQWDKNDLAETLLDAQSDIEHLLKVIENLMHDKNKE